MLDIEKLNVPENQNPYIDIKGAVSKNITIRTDNTLNENRVIIGKEVNRATIQIIK